MLSNVNIDWWFTLLSPKGALIVIMVYHISSAAVSATFSDFHSVHQCNWCYKCHSKSLKRYQCNWYHKSHKRRSIWSIGPLAHWSIDPLVHWSIGPLVRWSIGSLLHWSIGPLVECQMSNIICQMSNIKNQMSIRLNFLLERTSGVPSVIFSFEVPWFIISIYFLFGMSWYIITASLTQAPDLGWVMESGLATIPMKVLSIWSV